MAIISRKDLLRELTPALNQIFDETYAAYSDEVFERELWEMEVDFGTEDIQNA